MRKKFRYFLFVSLLSILFSGCLGTRYLKPGEKLLYKQRLKTPEGFNREGMSDLYVQKTNRKFPGLPINSLVWMYHKGEKRYNQEKFIRKKEKVTKAYDRKISKANTAKKKSSLQYRKQHKIDVLNGKIENGNMFMQWGEKAAVYDTANTLQTIDRLNNFLFTKGYFKSRVTYKETDFKRRVSITYFVYPGPLYIYDSIAYDIPDTTIHALLDANASKRLVKKGDAFNQSKLDKERERIDNLLKDNGYFDFTRDYIDYDVDTTYGEGHGIALRINIDNLPRNQNHKQFRVDSIIFVTDASTTGSGQPNLKRQSRVYRDITYSYYHRQYSHRVLSQRVFIHDDSLYSRSATLNTQRQLANLGIFKFVNINYDTTGGRLLANIFTSPLNRYSWSNEAGLTVTQGFPGPYYNMNFLKRNLFGGLEIFELNGRFGFEGVSPASQDQGVYKSVTGNLNASVTFPQFLFPLSANAITKFGKYNPKTKILAGYTYTDRPEYNRRTTTFSHTYTWENQRTSQYSLTLANLNIIRSTVDSAFNAILTSYQLQGNNLKNTFNPSFVSSMIFSWTWNPDNYGNTTTNSKYLRISAESGGTLLNVATPKIIVDEGLRLYKYLRLNADYRKNRVLDRNTILAYRFNAGIAWSYSEGRILPYEKYFFAGGSNSVRAWRPRRLGLGSAPPLLSKTPSKDGLFDYSFEKPGEILLEGSVELRKKLFGFVSGAAFIDWGNVWSFSQNQNTTTATEGQQADWTGNTRFDFSTFYKEFGVGTGFGLRFDFSFLILRLDAGIKAYDPARPAGERFVLEKLRFFKPFNTEREPVIFNVGIGYPF